MTRHMMSQRVFWSEMRPGLLFSSTNAIAYWQKRAKIFNKRQCVPVILALLDGLVSELHEKRRGFFSEEVDLAAWDSVAAHDKGLNALTKIFQTGRYTTVTEQITVPYRNGILHGMDLGYDNRMVAAKTWAALFATRDWSLRVEQGLLTAPAEEPKTTWRGLFQQIRENAEEKARLEEWKPRTICPGANIPATGEPDVFAPETPEHKLAEYMGHDNDSFIFGPFVLLIYLLLFKLPKYCLDLKAE